MKCLNCLNFMTAHAFLTGWYLFTFFTIAPFCCTPSVILDSYFILLASNTVIWASLFGAHRCKLEVEHFIFHVVVFSRWSLVPEFYQDLILILLFQEKMYILYCKHKIKLWAVATTKMQVFVLYYMVLSWFWCCCCL